MIPCFNEPDLLGTLNSLLACKKPSCGWEVIVVLNQSEDALPPIKVQQNKTKEEFQTWKRDNQDTSNFHMLEALSLPRKHAGVGLARKIGLDEGLQRLLANGFSQGALVSLDADCRVQENYLTTIEQYFLRQPICKSGVLHYEHPFQGNEKQIHAIAEYELHLRYYVHALRFAGFETFFHQTVGSTMLAKATPYMDVGGMNKRKAGEDFYFLQKLMGHGQFYTVPFTTVFPSPRTSDRVPFGTGKAVGELLSQDSSLKTYNFAIFSIVKRFIDELSSFYTHDYTESFPQIFSEIDLQPFFEAQQVWQKCQKAQANSTTLATFQKQFFSWCNAFFAMKFVHYLRDHGFEQKDVLSQSKLLLEQVWGKETTGQASVLEVLEIYRKMDTDLAIESFPTPD